MRSINGCWSFDDDINILGFVLCKKMYRIAKYRHIAGYSQTYIKQAAAIVALPFISVSMLKCNLQETFI